MNYLEMGGYWFTLPQTFIAFLAIAAAVYSVMAHRGGNAAHASRSLSMVLHLGVFAFVLGLLGQSLGLFQALSAIEAMGGVSPAMLAGGLKVSFITTIYGLLILTLSFLAWLVLRSVRS